MTISSPSSFVPALEADYRQLSNESRRSEGFVGLFASADHPEIKEAAERAVLSIRAVAHSPDPISQLAQCKDLFRPLQLAADTRSPRLAAHALSTAQRLVANGAASAGDGEALAGMLAAAARLSDETVRLRALQAALTLAQSPVHPTSEAGLGAVLSATLGLLSAKGNRDVVTSTAAATARQVLVLLLGYAPEGDVQMVAIRAATDICAMAAGQSPSWLKIQSLPRTQVLNLLEFVTSAAPGPFQTVAELREIVGKTMPAMLRPQLQDHFDAGVAALGFATSQFLSLRAALGCTRSLLSTFHAEMGAEAGALLQSLLAGLQGGHPEFQRVAVMHVVVHLLGDRFFLTWLVASFDCKQGQMLEAGRSLVEACLMVLEEAGKRGRDPEDEPPAVAVAQALGAAPGSLEPDPVAGAVPAQRAALGALAARGLGAMASSLETMAGERGDIGVGNGTPHDNGAAMTESSAAAKHLIEGMERSLLRVLRAWLGPSPPPEPLHQDLIQVLSTCTVAAGKAGCKATRDACLSLLCALSGGPGTAGGGHPLPTGEPSPAPSELAATRALLGVVHRLRGGLDGAWPSVLATLVYADRRLAVARASGGSAAAAGPHRSSAGGGDDGVSADAGSHTSDLDALSSSLTALYASSSSWPLPAVQGLVAGLCEASLEELVGREVRAGGGPGRAPVDERVAMGGSSVDARDGSTTTAMATMHMQHAHATAGPHLSGGSGSASNNPMPLSTGNRPLALGRLADVLLANAARLEELWALFLGHVLEVRARGAPGARIAAVEALGAVIVGTLSRQAAVAAAGDGVDEAAVVDDPASTAVAGNASDRAPGPPRHPTHVVDENERSEGLEQMLLAALESVHGDERDPEVRRAALRVLLGVLRRCGERLGGGWAAALRLLAGVPGDGDMAALDLGFQAVQLVAGDHASALPAPALRRCLEVASAYGTQQTDLNISLTTISLLWNVADVVGRGAPLGEGGDDDDVESAGLVPGPAAEATTTAPPPGTVAAPLITEAFPAQPGSPSSAVRLTAGEATGILELIFVMLQSLASDVRPEVRNSGLRTLFALVSAQGSRLPRARWEACLWETLFPLLRHAVRMSATSSREERGPAALGTLRGGETVTLVVHHSANSDAKQWDETVALALAGMGRLFRAQLPRVLACPAGPAGWDELMAIVEGCIAGARKRVALAAAAVLMALLSAHGGDANALDDRAWSRALRALSVAVEAIATPGCRVPLAVRLETIALVKSAAQAARARGDGDGFKQSLRWLERAARRPWSDDDANTQSVAGGLLPSGTAGLPPVQRACLAALGELTPEPGDIDLWSERLSVLAALLSPHQILEAAAERRCQMSWGGEGGPDDHADAPAPLGQGTKNDAQRLVSREGSALRADASRDGQPALSSRFLDAVLGALVKAYGNAPGRAQARMLPDVAAALGACMVVRYSIPEDDTWRVAAKAFVALVPLGLGALAEQQPDAGLEGRTWDALAEALEGFLLASGVVNISENGAVGDDQGLPIEPGHITPRTTSVPEGAAHGGSNPGTGTAPLDVRQESLGLALVSAPVTSLPFPPPAAALVQESEANPELSQTPSDDELEILVLDSLADSVLGLASAMPEPALARFVSIIDRGVCCAPVVAGAMGAAHQGSVAAAGLAYSQACLRKLYVLAAQCEPAGMAEQTRASATFPAAVAALRALLARCTDMLRAAAAGMGFGDGNPGPAPKEAPTARYGGYDGRPRLDEALCMLDVLATLTLAPEVIDALVPEAGERVCRVVALARALGSHSPPPGTKERTHLLLVYPALVAAVALPEASLRDRVCELLNAVGEQLGLADAPPGAEG